MKSTSVGDGFRRWLATLVTLTLTLAAACGERSHEPAASSFLIRVGHQIVTGQDFEAALAVGRIAYIDPEPEPPEIEYRRRVRLLNELVEESLILEKARSLGIEVTPEQLQAAEDRLRQDYPQGAFEAALLQNAVDLGHWRKRLRVKMILDKTVEQVIGARVTVTTEELTAFIGARSGKTSQLPGSDQDERLLKQLRRTKFEAIYPQWIQELRQAFPVQIDQAEWNRLSAQHRPVSQGSGPDRPAVAPRAAKDDDG